ncbi:MAG: hypothetical protein V7K44_31170, partial [Nostoc sp.]
MGIPHHFLGYWGYGAQQELEALLSSVLENLSPNLSPTRENSKPFPIWNVVYIGIDGNSPREQNQDLHAEHLKSRSPLAPLKKGGTLKAPFLSRADSFPKTGKIASVEGRKIMGSSLIEQ